jgi:tetratricopeptide (TPR) repeat protein
MGLFGSSPQKKLEKARELLAAGRWYEAMNQFEKVLEAGDKLNEGERSEAKVGHRRTRERMIALRLAEAEDLRLAGDLEAAHDRCQTALDLAGDDIDASAVREQLHRVEAPSRPVAAGPAAGEAAEDDLLPDARRRVILKPTVVDRPAAETPEPGDAELFGDDPAAAFELHLQALSEPIAAYFRTLGPDFQRGYVALVQGAGRRAVEFFERVDWEKVPHPAARRQRANAYLLALRGEEALAMIDAMAPPGAPGSDQPAASPSSPRDVLAGRLAEADGLPDDEPDGEARRRYMRIDALRTLGRLDEAVADATALADAAASEEPSLTLEAMLGFVLIEAGRPQEAFDRLSRRLRDLGYHDEILVPAAQAAVALERDDEAVELLEQFIHMRMERSLIYHSEVDFPVEAGRRLLEIHLRRGEEAGTLRTLIMHLIDHDPENGERYRDLLMQLDRKLQEEEAGEE